MSQLKDKYRSEIAPALAVKLGVKNTHGVPRLLSIVVNAGVGSEDGDTQKAVAGDIARITGQRPVMTKARKSISNFKLRKGMVVGAKVTLRHKRMYEFLERLIGAALPRIRDFRGMSPSSFDGRGNYSIGIKDLTIFPEIDPNSATKSQGMDITIVTTARNDEEGYELLKMLGMPFAAKSGG